MRNANVRESVCERESVHNRDILRTEAEGQRVSEHYHPHPHLNPNLQLVGGAAWPGLPLSAMVTHAWPNATPNRTPTPTPKPKPTPDPTPKPGPNLRLGGGAA